MLFLTIMQGMIIKPYLAVRLFGYKWQNFIKVYLNNLFVFVISLLIPSLVISFNEFHASNIITIVSSIISACLSTYFIGLDKYNRKRINTIIIQKIIHK